MKLSDLKEARYLNQNAAHWVQGAVNYEFEVYKQVLSWKKVAEIVGVQTKKFDAEIAEKEMTKQFGPPVEVDAYCEHSPNEGKLWVVKPTIPPGIEDEALYVFLDDYDGTIIIDDVVDADDYPYLFNHWSD